MQDTSGASFFAETGYFFKKFTARTSPANPSRSASASNPASNCDCSQTEDIWITANFKETQLRKMHPGQSVDVSVDTFSRKYHGYVQSMPGATGARTSLLPPENATGNFVKVVQRLPVRIRLKDGENRDQLLRPGMSAEPKVWLK